MRILLATNNKHKIDELKAKLVDTNIEILSPIELGITDLEVIEDADTLERNAFLKAKAFFDNSKIPTISDDTGLFVNALNGEPGVYSARYAGENATFEDNCNKLLNSLKDIENRNAYFETVICYYDGENINYLSGKCSGKITNEYRGENGFGYDPIFIPDGYSLTFAELSKDIKNKISHRGLAGDNFIEFIKNKI
jgi:XTP/dITP diphosphohydrolase